METTSFLKDFHVTTPTTSLNGMVEYFKLLFFNKLYLCISKTKYVTITL